FAALIEPPHAAAILDLREDDEGLAVTIEHTDVAPHAVDVVPVISPERSTWRYRQGGWQRG
ncbi:MAG: hypothetical protein WBA46_19525, partial [Thermomicrobiales bacterium]